MTTEPTDKLRALFLTALMVLSVFALTVSFAGTAAAANGGEITDAVSVVDRTDSNRVKVELTFNTSIDDGTDVPSDYTVYLTNGSTISVNDIENGIGGSTGSNNAQVVLDLGGSIASARIDKVNVTGAVSTTGGGSVVSENISVTSTSTSVIEGSPNTTAYQGEKVAAISEVGDTDSGSNDLDENLEIQDDEGGFYFDGSTGSGSQVHVFDTEGRDSGVDYWFIFDDRADFDGTKGDRRVRLRNLGLSVEADDTSLTTNDATIDATVSANAGNRDVDATLYYEGNDTVAAEKTVNLGGDATADISFDNPGEADYNITVTDVSTDIDVSTATISVSKVTGDADFAKTVFSEERGDVVNITVTVENRDTAEVYIGGPDINFGQAVDVEDGDDDDTVYLLWNTYDSTVEPAHSDDTATKDSSPDGAQTNIGAGFPVDTGSYALNVSIDGEETGVATIELVDRSFDDAQTWVAPGGADTGSASDIADNAVQMSSTAIGDKFVLQWSVSGVYGFLDKSFPINDSSNSDGLYLTIEQTNVGGNKRAVVLNSTNSSIILDADNNVFYTVIDSGSNKFADMDDGQSYEATLTIDETSPFIKADPDTAGTEKETVSTSFSVEEQTASIDNLNASDFLIVSAGPEDITGTATLAPGTNLTVRVKSTTTGVPYLETVTDVQIQSDGTWTATGFNFSGRSDTTFEVTVSVGGTELVSEDGAVLPPPTASVTFNDQDAPQGAQVVVQSVTMSRGGFVAIHSGSAGGPVIGSSKFLPAGTHTDVRISLDEPISEDTTLVAMPHLDTDGDNVYEFPDADGPYTADGAPVTDSASVAYSEAGTVVVTAESPTPMIVTRTVQPESPTPREVEVTRTVTVTQTPGQPGFGVAIAVVALLAAALLALRRRD